MTRFAIQASHVGKKYKLFRTARQRLWEAVHPLRRKLHEDFWALNDVSFNIEWGETVGVIGRNGSGKSTLLQIISGVLQPTSGAIHTEGRIAALLELGADFDPELTGRENVVLKGAMMGYSAADIRLKLPEIEAFADIGQFIDQPVRVYSSGIFVRLAFATAVSVEPDIMIVDEALSVGDARFQHKCYQRFRELQKQGKTILFVTHDMHAIARLCRKALLLERGKIVKRGDAAEVARYYHELVLTGELDDHADAGARKPGESKGGKSETFGTATEGFEGHRGYNRNEHRFGDGRGRIVDYRVVCGDDHDAVAVRSGRPVEIYVKAQFQAAVADLLFGIAIKTKDGIFAYGIHSRAIDGPLEPIKPDETLVYRFTVPLALAPGDYFVDLGIAELRGVQHVPIDVRQASVHLAIEQRRPFDGLADLGAELELMSRE